MASYGGTNQLPILPVLVVATRTNDLLLFIYTSMTFGTLRWRVVLLVVMATL